MGTSVVSSLTAIFGQPSTKSPADDDKLMDLYWNRNELKKEFANLRNEKHELSDRLKVQKGDFARLEQKIRHIEELLANPEWSRSITVHYQLREVDRECAEKVSRFAEQIKQQREQKKHGKAVAEWRATMARDVAAVEAEVSTIRKSIRQIEQQLQLLHQRFTSMNGLLRFFKRRFVNKQASEAADAIAELEATAEQHAAAIEEIQQREPPETVGLTLLEKRSINAMILAYAQELYCQFQDDQLVSLVKEASDKSAGAIRYGSDAECEELLDRLRRAEKSLQSAGGCTESLKKRSKLIGEAAQYQHSDHAVPLPATVARLYRFDQAGQVCTGDLDLLGSNYWNLSSAMSR